MRMASKSPTGSMTGAKSRQTASRSGHLAGSPWAGGAWPPHCRIARGGGGRRAPRPAPRAVGRGRRGAGRRGPRLRRFRPPRRRRGTGRCPRALSGEGGAGFAFLDRESGGGEQGLVVAQGEILPEGDDGRRGTGAAQARRCIGDGGGTAIERCDCRVASVSGSGSSASPAMSRGVSSSEREAAASSTPRQYCASSLWGRRGRGR